MTAAQFISTEKGVRMSSIINELTTETVRAARAHILRGFTVFPSIYAVCDDGIHGLVSHDALDALEAEDAVLSNWLAARDARVYGAGSRTRVSPVTAPRVVHDGAGLTCARRPRPQASS
jgi:hypothetical protein